MAQARVVLEKDQFNCSICLDVLKDPVTIPCGHSYCSNCINCYWNQDDYRGVFVCPQCRQTFNPRPVLAKNTVLTDVVEKFKKTGLHDSTTPQQLAKSDDVECDVCTVRKNKAIKSCLVCLASYCDLHVQPHYESDAFKKHKLVSASKNLQETICPRHDRLLEVYCRTDKQCICYQCLTDEHKGHDTVLAEAEKQRRQMQLVDIKQTAQLRIQQRQNVVHELTTAIFFLTRSAWAAAEESDSIFTELIRLIELKRFEVRELVMAQEKTAVGQAQQLLDKIQKEIAELKNNEAELDRLCHIDDHIHFLQSSQAALTSPVLSAMPPVTVVPNLNFDSVMTAVSDFKGLVEEVCQGEFVSIYERMRDVVIVAPALLPVHISATQSGDTGSAAQMDVPTVMPLCGLDKSPVNLDNPLPTVSAFAFSPFGAKLSSGSRQRHLQRRARPRRK